MATYVGLSLALGVTFYGGVSWYIHQNAEGPPTTDPDFARLLTYAWVAFTTVTIFTAAFFWRTRVDPMINGSQSMPRERMPQLTANLLICWALIESGCLFGVTIYFLTGIIWAAAISVVLMWVAFLATRPQPEWYERFR